MPTEFLVEYDDPRLDVKITLEVAMSQKGAECVELTAEQRPGGRPVSLRALKDIKVGEITERAVRLAAKEITWVDGGEEGLLLGDEGPVVDHDAFEAAYAPGRQPVTNALLRELAEVYVKAKPTGKPHKAVVEHFGWSDSKAHRLQRRAARFIAELENNMRGEDVG